MTKQNLSENATAKKYFGTKPAIPLMQIGIAGGVLMAAIVIFVLTRSKANAPVNEIPAAQAFEAYQRGAFFLDVRTLEEWEQGHIANSTLIPLNELAARVGELPKDQPIVVVCRSGKRSKEGISILMEAGFSQLFNLEGGILAWRAAGYALES